MWGLTLELLANFSKSAYIREFLFREIYEKLIKNRKFTAVLKHIGLGILAFYVHKW